MKKYFEKVDEAQKKIFGNSHLLKKENINFTWLVEPDKNPLSKLLMIDSIPRMILIDNEGNVLFNGHPNDPSFHDVITTLRVKL